MSKLDKYLSKNYKKLKEVSDKITSCKHADSDDLLHDTILALYDSNEEKINKLIDKNELIFWIARIMVNQYHSKTSRYYYKYDKYYEYHTCTTIENITADNTEYTIKDKKEVEEKLEWIEEKLKDLYWFDAEIFRIYYREGFSLNQMAKETKISRATIYKAVKNVKNYLINEL